MNIYIVLGIIFLVVLIILIVLVIVFQKMLPPLNLIMSGNYMCKGHEKYWRESVDLYPFVSNVYQPQNAAYLSILNYDTSIDECKEDKLTMPRELHPYYYDIYVDKGRSIRYARIYHVKDNNTILVYLQSMKYREIMFDTLKFWKTEYDGMYVYSGLWSAYQTFRDELMSALKHHKGNIVFFGHSTGGTFSNYAAFDLVKNYNYDKNKVFVYSYGELPPGDEKFRQKYDKVVPNTYTITNGRDSILSTLVKWGYRFVGKDIEINFESKSYYNHSLSDYINALVAGLKS